MSNCDIYTFSVDQAPPSIEYNVVKKVQNPDDSYTYQSAGSDDSISLTDSSIVGFKLKGTVSDVNGIKEFTIDDDYFNFNTYGYIVSYTEEELRELYRIEFDTIFNVIIEEIKKYGYEKIKDIYYFSPELKELFNPYIENNNLK